MRKIAQAVADLSETKFLPLFRRSRRRLPRQVLGDNFAVRPVLHQQAHPVAFGSFGGRIVGVGHALRADCVNQLPDANDFTSSVLLVSATSISRAFCAISSILLPEDLP